MKVSPKGRALIARNEGCVLYAYPDPTTGGAPWTIGYGHTAGVRPGQQITQQQADDLLASDLDTIYGPRVETLLAGAPTTQAQFDAMVSLAYNIGLGDWQSGRIDRYDAGGFEDSSILKNHLKGEYQAAADSFVLWNKAGGRVMAGLTRRRLEEAKLYRSDSPVAAPSPAAIHPDLRLGSQGPAVKELQRRLIRLGFDCGPFGADGDFGEDTDEAVERFQKARKIWPGTVVLRSTWNELAQAEAEKH